jgi:hypothetical protein
MKKLQPMRDKLNNFFSANPRQKTLFVVYLLIFNLALGAAFFEVLNLSRKKSVTTRAADTPASLFLSPNSLSVAPQQEFVIDIFLDPNGEAVAALDAQVRFDPQRLEYVSFSLDNSNVNFPHYPLTGTLVGDNMVVVSAVNFDPATQSFTPGYQSGIPGLLATLTFRAKEAGNTNLSFNFTLGATDDSNVMKEGTVDDILGEARSATIAVVSPTPTQGPTPTLEPGLECLNCWKGVCDGECNTRKEGPACPDCQQLKPGEPTPTPDPACGACFKNKCDGRCHPKEVGTTCPDCL